MRGRKEKFDIAPGQDFRACRNIVRSAMPGKLAGDTGVGAMAAATEAASQSHAPRVRTAEPTSLDQRSRLLVRVRSGANWFFWIAGLSILNAVLFFAGSDVAFVVGLGAAMAATVGMKEGESGLQIAALVLTLIIVAIFVGLGLAARRGKNWAFITGVVLYALDGLIFVAVRAWWSAGFHALALYFISLGAIASFQLKKLDQSLSAASGPGTNASSR